MHGVFFIFLLGPAVLSFVTMAKGGLCESGIRAGGAEEEEEGGGGGGGARWRNDIFAGARERAKLLARDGMRMLLLVRCAAADERGADATRASSRAAMHPPDYDYFSD